MSEENHALNNAQAFLDRIVSELADYNDKSGDEQETIREECEQEPLSVQVRTAWHNPGEEKPDREYNILLTTGGPALRIVGDLNQYGEPETARLECQDWFKPWSRVPTGTDEDEALNLYVSFFYFGE